MQFSEEPNKQTKENLEKILLKHIKKGNILQAIDELEWDTQKGKEI